MLFARSHADGGFRGKIPTENATAAVEAINWRAPEKERKRQITGVQTNTHIE